MYTGHNLDQLLSMRDILVMALNSAHIGQLECMQQFGITWVIGHSTYNSYRPFHIPKLIGCNRHVVLNLLHWRHTVMIPHEPDTTDCLDVKTCYRAVTSGPT